MAMEAQVYGHLHQLGERRGKGEGGGKPSSSRAFPRRPGFVKK